MRRRWTAVRSFALSLPAAREDFPWGEPVVKVEKAGPPPSWRQGLVHGPMFVWLGAPGADPPAISVKLTDARELARSAGAVPTAHSGLGQWGWVTVPVDRLGLGLLCDLVEESYRNVAPRRMVAALDAARDAAAMRARDRA